MGLYNLIKVLILLANALVIINERFLKQIGLISSGPTIPNTNLDIPQPLVQEQKLTFFSAIMDKNVKVVVHYPLIIANIILILFESLLG
jgi:hypothetical protein